MDFALRIAALRHVMSQQGIAAVIVPSSDPHLSEYLPERWKGRKWLTGFRGSVGTLVVTCDFAGLWTDSRYFEQAERELAGGPVQLMRLRIAHTPEHVDWLVEHLQAGDAVAVSGDVLGLAARDQMRERFEAKSLILRTDLDLLDQAWPERPALPDAPVREHAPAFAAATRSERLARVRGAVRAHGATHHLVSALDDIAWITTLRGSDIPYNPVFLAHLLIGPERATLFVSPGKIPPALAARLAMDGIDLAAYSDVTRFLGNPPPGASLLLDPRRVVCALIDAVPADIVRIETTNPSQRFKSLKTEAELEQVRRTMEKDGVAMVRFLRWLESALERGDALTEVSIGEKLQTFRAAQADFVSESFATIAGYEANGAMPHYRATPAHHAKLEPQGLLVLDSGGQYEGGTTDITRTLPLGDLTPEQRRDYTLVLQGMIALSRARFPRGTTGQQLDALARAPIWAEGVNYGHGTGHGVGYFLNVHEGPQSIRPALPGETGAALEAGMITSNEPGIYRPGRHGVRIENLIATVPAGRSEFGDFLAFETLTLCPIDVRPLERERLRRDEIEWLNGYHRSVVERLGPSLNVDERAWLHQRCTALA
jgi:Xaa-Pro aminopeptidase